MQILVGIIVLALYSAITFYIGWCLKKWLQSINVYRWPAIYWSILFLISFSPMFGMSMEVFSFLRPVGYFWMFFLEYGLLVCIGAQLLMLIPKFRNVKIVGSVSVAMIAVLFVAGLYYAYTPTVRELTIEIEKEGEPLRVVMASDFHLGMLSGKKHLSRFVQLSNEAEPDIVLLSGDIIDDDPKWYIDQNMQEEMLKLEATYGIYGAVGNHEYYGGKMDEFLTEMEKSNVRMLLDETVLIDDSFYLTGREDLTNEKRLPLSELKPENIEKPWFVINHTPLELAEMAKEKVDLMVFGHTHKGQLWPNEYITSLLYELDYGHKQFDEMHAVVSSGFGFWGPPMRIGSQAELWVIDVKFKTPE